MDTKVYSSSSFFPGIGDEVLVGVCLMLGLCYLLHSVISQYLPALSPSESAQSDDLASGRVRSNVHDCSICLGEAALALETNCGHVFCGQCIMSYYDTVTSSSVKTALCKYYLNAIIRCTVGHTKSRKKRNLAYSIRM